MTEPELHRLVTLGVIAAGVLTFLSLRFIRAPYGRHYTGGWGPSLPSRAGWILMESPAVLAFLGIYLLGDHRFDLAPLCLLALWQLHYLQRTVVYPLIMRAEGKRMPVMVAGMAVGFNLVNAYINARWISHLGSYPDAWLADPRLWIGAAVFLVGFAVNVRSDRILIALRRPGEQGYKIPHGGAFRWVSAPNYLGELLEWTGWAIATWSLPGLAFLVYTAANLVPRALDNHKWYRERFPDYPPERRALVPFVL